MTRIILAALLLSVAVSACVSKPPEFAGYRMGQSIDVTDPKARADNGLSSLQHLEYAALKKNYYECEVSAPKEGLTDLSLVFSTDKKIVGMYGGVKCKDVEDAKATVKAIAENFGKKYEDRVAENCNYKFEVSHCRDFVEISFLEKGYAEVVEMANNGGRKDKPQTP